MAIADYVCKNNIALVLLCGDILHRGNPTPTTENILGQALRTMTESGARVVFLLGNHEVPGWGDHPAQIYRTLDVPGVIIADKPDIHRIKIGETTLQLATIPYSAFSSRPFGEILNDLIQELSPDMPAILMMHIFINGVKLSGSDLDLLPNEPNISALDIYKLPFAYIALGHIHRHQAISTMPPAVYPGSIQRVSFAEVGEQKGFVDVELNIDEGKSHIHWNFIPLDAMEFKSLEIDLRGKSNQIDEIEKALKNASIKNTILRITIIHERNDPKPPAPAIIRMVQKYGAIMGKIYDSPIAEKSSTEIRVKPTGDMFADIEQYIRAKYPQMKEKSPELFSIIRELLAE